MVMNEKDGEQIVEFKGPDRVRKRPAVAFYSSDATGAFNAFKALLDIFVTESRIGSCNGITVIAHRDNSFSVRSYDEGFALDENDVDGKPAWYYYLCDFYAGPRWNYDLQSHFVKSHNSLYGRNDTTSKNIKISSDSCMVLCCVQYVSSFMHIEATHKRVKKILDFEKGYCVSDLYKECTDGESNTFIHFMLDSEVFDDTRIDLTDIRSFLNNAAANNPGLKCKLKDENTDSEDVFVYL